MNFRAILVALLIASIILGALLFLAIILELSAFSVPQVLVVFALWSLPGYYAAARAADAGSLHGLLTGLVGMLIAFFGIELVKNLLNTPLDLFNSKSPFIFMILAGFWGAVGGLVADSVRLIKAKRALSRGSKRSPGSG